LRSTFSSARFAVAIGIVAGLMQGFGDGGVEVRWLVFEFIGPAVEQSVDFS